MEKNSYNKSLKISINDGESLKSSILDINKYLKQNQNLIKLKNTTTIVKSIIKYHILFHWLEQLQNLLYLYF